MHCELVHESPREVKRCPGLPKEHYFNPPFPSTSQPAPTHKPYYPDENGLILLLLTPFINDTNPITTTHLAIIMTTSGPPPLTMAADHPRGPWECSTCAEEFEYMEFHLLHARIPWRTTQGDLVCDDCIRHLFTQAMKFDFEFPTRWAGAELNIRHFATLWTDRAFVQGYEWRRAAFEAERTNLNEQSLKAMVPKGFVQGKDFQRCPKCKTAISLKDGCNHMYCTCGQEFCYICGKAAKDGTNHWAPGGCPRYNQPGHTTAFYDDPDDDQGLVDDPTMGAVVSFPVWTWNLTMQTTDPGTRDLMQRMLGLPTAHGARRMPLTEVERSVVLETMLRNGPQNGVTDAEWEQTVAANLDEALAFVSENGGEFNEANTDAFPIHHGVLSHPVGGVFNMVTERGQNQAFAWAMARKLAFDASEPDNANNFAIFDVGPGGPAEGRESVANFLEMPRNTGGPMTGDLMSFTQIATVSAFHLLVQYTNRGSGLIPDPEGRHNPLFALFRIFRARDHPAIRANVQGLNEQVDRDWREARHEELFRERRRERQEIQEAQLAAIHAEDAVQERREERLAIREAQLAARQAELDAEPRRAAPEPQQQAPFARLGRAINTIRGVFQRINTPPRRMPTDAGPIASAQQRADLEAMLGPAFMAEAERDLGVLQGLDSGRFLDAVFQEMMNRVEQNRVIPGFVRR